MNDMRCAILRNAEFTVCPLLDELWVPSYPAFTQRNSWAVFDAQALMGSASLRVRLP
jgi:hypothetical protein